MNLDILTKRERQVYERHLDKLSASQIAADLGISTRNVGVTLLNARRRIESGVPAVKRRSEQEVLMRVLNEPRCRRCKIRGHVEGDPIRCLPSAAEYALRREEAPVRISPNLTGEHKPPHRPAL